MAAFLRHGAVKGAQLLTPKNVLPCGYATKAEKKKGMDRKKPPKIDSSTQSLAAKGFLRPQKEYIPPEDVHDRLNDIFKSVLGENKKDNHQILDIGKRFTLLTACFEKFGHSVPNSLLFYMNTLGDVRKFYATPVDIRTPLDRMKNMDLPENLHIQFDYHRFNPATEKFFDGETAFPESSTLVTGLKYKDKYEGHVQKKKEPWY